MTDDIRKKARYTAAIMMAVVLTGCTSVEPTYTKGGSAGYTIKCLSGTGENCYTKAGQLCGQLGYDVVQQSNGTRSSIVVACKVPPEEPLTIQIPESSE